MRNCKWWKKQKKRVKNKYILLMGWYLSPKESKKVIKWRKNYEKAKKQ